MQMESLKVLFLPALFNIYIEDLIINLKSSCEFKFECLLYADDIVFIVKHKFIGKLITKLEQESQSLNL